MLIAQLVPRWLSAYAEVEFGDASPDANSFWLLREKLKETGKYDDLFQALLAELSEVSLEYSKCAIVDATFIEAPRRRNISKEDNPNLPRIYLPCRQ
ncbi:hypothetical protein FACS1894187_18610 [Synergistales bacterium]|nr:hypothetical protein FACS1894187_18610 [Synergistales bacterium]